MRTTLVSDNRIVMEENHFYDFFIWDGTNLLGNGRAVSNTESGFILYKDMIKFLVPEHLVLDELKVLVLKDLGISLKHAEGITAMVSTKRVLNKMRELAIGEKFFLHGHKITVLGQTCSVKYQTRKAKEEIYKLFEKVKITL